MDNVTQQAQPSDRARKLLDTLKANGVTHEGNATDADHIARLAKMPKGQVNEALQQLVQAKLVRRIEHHKAARYVVVPQTTTPAAPR